MKHRRPLNGSTVYVIGLDYRVRNEIPWYEAVTHILRGKMTPFEVHPTKRIRSAGGLSIAHPLIVRLNYWVQPPQQPEINEHSRATRAQILRRDSRTCAYCGEYATTVDHIQPYSRGGGWTWGNLVACCFECNQLKADRTPEEAGMKLLWHPNANTNRYTAIQKRVDSILEENKEYYDTEGGYDSFEGWLGC